jgi:peroxiredoxin
MSRQPVGRRVLLVSGLAASLVGVRAIPGHAFENASFDLGPPVGSPAPTIGTPPDQTGKPRTLASLMGDKGLVLFFFRSADWCPFCQAQLMDLSWGLKDVEKRGYHIAGISYDSPEILKNFTDRREIGYVLLSDPKSEVIDRYKLRDPQYPPGNKAYGVPQPIIFVLDRNGVIRAKLYEDNYKKRPPVSAVIEAIDMLTKTKN